MAIFQDPLSNGDDSNEPSAGGISDFGLRLYKSAEEAFHRDVAPKAQPVQAPAGTPDQEAYRALFGGATGSGTGSTGSTASLTDQEAYQALFGGVKKEAPKPEQGNFSRGFEVSGKQLKQTAYGTAALIGDTVGATDLKEWGLKGYQDAAKEVQSISKETDSFSTAFEKGELGKWLTYSSGYLVGQVAELGAASIAGAVAGSFAAPGAGTVAGALTGAVEKGAVQAGVKSFVGKMIDKQVASNLARGMTEEAATSAALKSVYGKIGATTANTFLNATQELGSIYGDAVEEAALTGKEYSLGKVWLSGIAATAVDSWADSKAVGKFMDSIGGSKDIKGVALEALKGGFREGMTEGVQTAVERWGANKDLTSKEAFRDYIDSAAVGILGGGVAGGSSGALNKLTSSEDKGKGGPAPGESSDITQDTADKNQPQISAPVGIEKGELIRTMKNMDAMAYLYDSGDEAQKASIERAVQRANLIAEFNQAKGNVDAIRTGESQLASEPLFVETLRNAMETFGKTQPTDGKVKFAPRDTTPPPSQFDQEDGQAVAESSPADANKASVVSKSATETTTQKPIELVAQVIRGEDNLSEDMRNDPLISRLAAYSALTFKNEKVSDPREWTPEESAAYKQSAEAFSKVRGYTDEQIQQYKTYVDLVQQVREKYGEDAIFDVENPFVQKKVFDAVYGKGAYAAQEKLHTDNTNRVNLKERQEELKAKVETLQTEDDGIRFSRTSKKVTVSDLPSAIEKVMGALANTGVHNFLDMSAEVMKRMRASQDWSPMAGNVTPAMLRTAYNKLNFAEKQSPEAVAAVTTKQLRDAVAAAVKPVEQASTDLDVNEEAKKVDLEILNENRTLEQQLGKDWSKRSVPASEVTTELSNIDNRPKAAESFDRLEELKKRQKELLEEQRQEAKFAKPQKDGQANAEPIDDQEVLNTYFRKAKDNTGRKQLPVSKRTPAIRRALAKMSQADQKEALLSLGGRTDEELAKVEAKLTEIEERQAQREVEKSKGKNLELDVTQSQPQLVSEKFAKKVKDLLAMRNETKFFRDTLAQMQAALTELDKGLRNKKTIREGGKTFQAVDLTDEHAYLWSEGQGFNIPKNLPEEKVLALRRKLVDQIREMQQQSIKGQADLFLNSISRLDYELSLARNEAMRDGVPQDAIDRVYTPARELLVNMRNEFKGKPVDTQSSPEAESAISDAIQADFFENDLAARKIVDGLKAERSEDRLSPIDAVRAAMRGMRDGSFTFGDLMAVLRENGADAPQQLYSVAGHISMQKRMLEHVKDSGFTTGARLNWLRSMDSVVTRFPELLESNTFTDGEKLQYEEWKEARKSIQARRKVDEVTQLSNDVEQAFPGLLFNDYTLSRVRNETSIPAEKLAALKDTVGDLEQAWFQDVAFALQTRPDLRNQIEAAIRPEDMTEFREWLKTKERAVEKEAEIIAKMPYFQALRAMPGFEAELDSTPEKEDGTRAKKLGMYEKFYAEIANSQVLGLDRIIANAERVGDVVRTSQTDQQNLEARLSEFIDESVFDDQLDAGDYALDIDGSMGREGSFVTNSDESVEDLANEDEGFNFNDEYGDDVDELRLRRGFFGGVLTAAHVQAHVARITSKWKSAPQISVIQNAAMLPEPLRTKVMERLGENMGAKGVFDSESGQVYLFSDMLAGDADTEFTLFHEVYGHLGLRAFLGAKFDTFLKNMYNAYPRIKAEVDAVMKSEGLPLLEAIDEVISDFAGKGQQIPAVKAWVGKIVAGLRELGLGRVADWIAKISNAELAYYLKGAQESAKNGDYTVMDGAPASVRLAEERLPYELFSLKGDTTAAYARFNPVTQTWAVFKANSEDIRNGYSAVSMDKYEDVLEFMRKAGYVERRKRSGVFVDDKLPGDMPKMAAATDVTGMKRWMRDLITRYQNEYKPVFDVVDYLKAQGRLTDRMDVKTALLLYERKTGAVVEHFRRNFVEPIMKLVGEAKEQGADYDLINRFLLARHAEERNKQIARVNPKLQDGGSGMKTAEAKAFLKSLENNPAFDMLQEIGRMTDKMSEQKLKYQVNTGMITIKQANAMRAAYKNYVNLSGLKEGLDGFDDPSRLAGGSKFNVKGKEQRAMGRESEATDILGRTILGMEAALIRGQKNLVAQRVLALVEANYDPNFAVVNEIAYKKVIGEDGMVTEQEDAEYIRRKDVMVAKINGIPATIRFKDTERGSFADAIHGMVYPPDSSPWLARLGKFNQLVGQMLTTWNPAWVAVNFARDVQTMYFNAASDGRITKAQAAQMVKALPSAIKTALYMASNGKLNINVDPEMVRIYNEMKRAGGLTSFLNRKDLEEQVDEIHQMLGERTKAQKIGDKFKGVLDLMEYMTLPMEIAPRLAAYKIVRDGGFTADQAAVFSGEITVNFNMRGSVKEMRQLFLFFNPAVQGSAKMVSLARNNPGRLTGYAFAFAGLGAMANLIARAAGDDDEAGRNDLDKVPSYKRATSIVIAPNVPGGAIPIPYGWNAFYAAGHFMMDSILGVQPVSVTAKRIAQTAFEAYTPMGTAGLDSKSTVGTVLKGVAPTATLPIVEWVMNENRYGAPIRKEGDQFGGAVAPDSQMAFRSVSPISKSIAESLNEVTGGNKYKAGAIDVNPAAIDFIIGSYAPGLVNESYKAASTAARVARGEEVKNTPMPLVDRFTAKTPEGFDAGAFRRAKEMIETRFNEYKNMPELRDEIRKEAPGLMQAHAIVASTTQQIREVRARLTAIEKIPGISEAEKVDRLNRTRELETSLYNRAVKAVMNAGPEFKEAVMAAD